MGSKYPVLSPKQVIDTLCKFGFKYKSQKGSHMKYVKESNPKRIVVIPNHSEIAKGTLKSILEQAGLTLEEFLKAL